jgi:hypothetical protein
MIVPTTGSPEPGIYNPELFTLQLFNDCSCCCPCEAYENVYKAMARIHSSGSQTGTRIARTIDDLKNLSDKVWDEKARRAVPTMDLMLRPAPGYIMGVQINLLNNRTEPNIFMAPSGVGVEAKVKMFITSTDAPVADAVILNTSCWLYNNRYGNPWIHVTPSDLFTTTLVSDPEGIGLIIKPNLVPTKFYDVIFTTEFVSMFFEVFWPESANPADGDVVKVKLVSSLFKPYNLQKEDKLIEPFEGTV